MYCDVSKICGRLRSVIAAKGSNKVTYLLKENVLEWLFAEPDYIGGLTYESEKAWGMRMIGKSTNQWTTKLGEEILHEILILLGMVPSKIKNRKRGSNNQGLDPDRETQEALWENKARTYTTTGTAGEKVLGSPLKYCECFDLYGKPLYIVCMAFQEVEASKSFGLFDPKSQVRRDILDFIEERAKIRFVRATELLMRLLEN